MCEEYYFNAASPVGIYGRCDASGNLQTTTINAIVTSNFSGVDKQYTMRVLGGNPNNVGFTFDWDAQSSTWTDDNGNTGTFGAVGSHFIFNGGTDYRKLGNSDLQSAYGSTAIKEHGFLMHNRLRKGSDIKETLVLREHTYSWATHGENVVGFAVFRNQCHPRALVGRLTATTFEVMRRNSPVHNYAGYHTHLPLEFPDTSSFSGSYLSFTVAGQTSTQYFYNGAVTQPIYRIQSDLTDEHLPNWIHREQKYFFMMTPGLAAAGNFALASTTMMLVDNFCFGTQDACCTLDADEQSPLMPNSAKQDTLQPNVYMTGYHPTGNRPRWSHGAEGRFPKPIYHTACPPGQHPVSYAAVPGYSTRSCSSGPTPATCGARWR